MTDNLKVTRPKTLKDIVMLKMTRFMIRQEAIKWIKGDMYHYEKDGFVSVVDMKQIARWMKRLDITEGDLE